MTDYVRAHDNPTNIYYREARKLADQLRQETTLETRGINAGVLRWKSNNAVVPEDAAKLAFALGIRISLDACNRVRDQELVRFLSAYRRACAGKGLTAEERFEVRGAFAPGAKVINIATGKEHVV